jgi:hypothetical protein
MGALPSPPSSVRARHLARMTAEEKRLSPEEGENLTDQRNRGE